MKLTDNLIIDDADALVEPRNRLSGVMMESLHADSRSREIALSEDQLAGRHVRASGVPDDEDFTQSRAAVIQPGRRGRSRVCGREEREVVFANSLSENLLKKFFLTCLAEDHYRKAYYTVS